MNLSEAIAQLRSLNEPVPKPFRLPTLDEVAHAEAEIGVAFHSDLKEYLLEASDVVVGTLEPITIVPPESHTHVASVLANARLAGIPEDSIPICEDNGDYYLIHPDGHISYWSHDGFSDERWPKLSDWIKNVWINKRQA